MTAALPHASLPARGYFAVTKQMQNPPTECAAKPAREPRYNQPLEFRAVKLDDDPREIDGIALIARIMKLSDR
jgi:hypothetical protein